MSIPDIDLGGNGTAWGHTRTYSNQLSANYDYGNGYNWMVEQWPYLVQQGDNTVVVVWSNTVALWFDEAEGGFGPRFGAPYSMKYDSTSDVYTIFSPNGDVWQYYGFIPSTSYPPGAFKSHAPPGGATVAAISYVAGKLQEVQRTYGSGSSEPIESYVYTWISSGVNSGRLSSVTLRVQPAGASTFTAIQQASYSYCGTGDSQGSVGDLKLAVRQYMDGGIWYPVDTYYYRYYTSGESGGFVHGLKYVVGPSVYKNMTFLGLNPLTMTDAAIAEYADHYFVYDSLQRVVEEQVFGGTALYTFDYTSNDIDNDYNQWLIKTVETRPDSSQEIVYSNYVGETLLSDFRASTSTSGPHWVVFQQFDENANLVMRAAPSAVAGYIDDGGAGEDELIVTLWPSAGVILNSSWAGSFLTGMTIQNGVSGSPIKLFDIAYTSHSASDGAGGTYSVSPVSSVTAYLTETDQTNPANQSVVSFAYTWLTDGLGNELNQIQQRTTTFPVVPTTQNGTGLDEIRTEIFDQYANLIWERGPLGFIANYSYDTLTGALLQDIQDCDGSKITLPSGWSTPAGGGQHLITDYEIDYFGRTTQMLGPAHDVNGTMVRTAAWVLDLDATLQTWSAKGYSTGSAPNYNDTYTLVGTVTLNRVWWVSPVIEQIESVRSSGSGRLAPTDVFNQSDWMRWQQVGFTSTGQFNNARIYHLIPSSGSGTLHTNYEAVYVEYDNMGRLVSGVAAGGTIFQIYFDQRSRPTTRYIGSSGSEMVAVEQVVYDGGLDQADDNVTQIIRYVDASTTRITNLQYNWRNRLNAIQSPLALYATLSFDNVGELIELDLYNTPIGNLIGRGTQAFDPRGRSYKSTRYAVDPSSGTVGNAIQDQVWYNASESVLEILPGDSRLFQKFAYDGIGQLIQAFAGYTPSGSTNDPTSVTDDLVLEQANFSFDPAGNLVAIAAFQRFHTDTTSVGALIAPPTSGANAWVSYTALWQDEIGRTTSVGDYGTNGGSAFSRPDSPPVSSASVLVANATFDALSQLQQLTDPAGIATQWSFDAVARIVEQIENYVSGGGSTSAQNVTTQLSYTADGLIATLVAVNSTTGNQTTTWAYGSTLSESDIADNTLLRLVTFPDGSTDVVGYAYNRQREVKQFTDQLGTVHSLLHDLLGRLTDDCITTLGSGVDGAVRRISLGYEVRGMLQSIASFDNATPGSGTQLDEVFMAFDNLANPSQEYQEHQGAHTSSSLRVGYNYDSSNSGGFYTKGSRPKSLAYPSGRLLDITYGSSGSIADSINRLDKLSDDSGGTPSTTLAAYSYLGLSQIVIEDFQQPQVRLDYYQGTPGTYAGFDLFGRIVSQLWTAYGSSAVADLFSYGFDKDSNRTYRKHNNATGQDEFYGYDDLFRLTAAQRGTLNSTNTGISGTPAAEFDFTFDPTGNWKEYVEKISGTTSLDQTRSHTEANEISAIGASTGPTWLTPVYDAAGNMTTMPNPANLTAGLTGTYDAWKRLVKVQNGTTVLAQFRFDGLNRRIVENLPDDTSTLVRHAYYNAGWQLLETRTGSSTSTPPASLPVEYQYVWSARYIDAPILRDAPNATGAPRYYFLTDANMNVTALLDTSATALERYLYSPYGTPVIFDGTWSTIRSSSLYDNGVLFAGYRFDSATGLYLARNRFLQAELGLWTSRDLIGYSSGPNLFAYSAGSPGNFVDPAGLFLQIAIGAASNILIGLALAKVRGECYGWNDALEDAAIGAAATIGIGLVAKVGRWAYALNGAEKLYWFGSAEAVASKEIGGVFEGLGRSGVQWATSSEALSEGALEVGGKRGLFGAAKDLSFRYTLTPAETELFQPAFNYSPNSFLKGLSGQFASARPLWYDAGEIFQSIAYGHIAGSSINRLW